MGWKIILSALFIIFAIFLLILYWFLPISTTEFQDVIMGNNGEEIILDKNKLQFYPDMRFPDKRVSYRIEDCPIQKKVNMKEAFEILENSTPLNFYPVVNNEQIHITCDSHTKLEGNMFIAGEGGPTNVTQAGKFNVIAGGRILLFRESQCPKPNVALHELLHVLGFDHTSKPSSIMYSVSSCSQEVDTEITELLNDLYSIPSYPDLSFQNVSATMHGKYLNVNMSVRNEGLSHSLKSKISIYADDKKIKELNVDALMIGHGRIISLSNVFVNKLSVQELKFSIESSFDELKKENNEIVLKIKK